MLKIYYGDGSVDKEKFIFDQIDPQTKTILLVPDQFSLRAEQDALQYCGQKALMELMITDFNALGHKVVRRLEGRDPEIIDKYGRHMLLSVLIERLDDQLTVFRGRSGGNAFADQMNTMISEMKRYNIGSGELVQALDQLKEEARADGKEASSFLILKLEDMLRIFRAYEEAIGGLYRDAEDYITYYADRIPSSDLVQGAHVWIYGFDTFTPKNIHVIRRLLETAQSVSVVMTYEDGKRPPQTVRKLTQGGGSGLFRLTERMMQKLEEAAEEGGQKHARIPIEGYETAGIWAPEDELTDRIVLTGASSPYEEAECAAAFIQSLVRDEGYRYGEIAVLCNDMDGRGRVLGRAFDRWGIPAFADRKRKVLHQPVVSFLLSFLDVLTTGFRGDGILGMVKSGLLGWSADDEALIENYASEFHIRGSRWQDEFVWDGGRYTETEMGRLNEMRRFLVSVCDRAKDAIGRRNIAEEKISGLISFLEDDFRIADRIGDTVSRQQELGLLEGAAETAQIWNAVCGIFGQIVQVIGQEKVSNGMLRDMIIAGLETLEIGLVPVSGECVIVGTLQRSRPGHIRALVVTGANAGLLPLDMTDEGLLSRREKERLAQMDLEFAGKEQMTQMEEQLAIYRMFSMPSERLYVSCSQSGEDGTVLRPSEVFRQLMQWQPEINSDLGRRPLLEQIGSAGATVPYLAEALREDSATGWQQVLDWYSKNDPALASRILRGLQFTNKRDALGSEMADALYRGDRKALEVSASRLEKFSGCPFSHFVQYGLRAQEQRLFEVGGREIGDVYHQCMMEFSRELEAASGGVANAGADVMVSGADAAMLCADVKMSGLDAAMPGMDVTPAAPTWGTITEAECRSRVREILEGSAEGYREGLFSTDNSSRFRMERITDICGDIAWAMVCQVRQGNIRRMYFEEPFGRGGRLPAVEVELDGRKIRIIGTIDRMDVLDTGEGQPDAVRIIDYKTGNNVIRAEDFETGYKLQLMVYMDAALKGADAGTVSEAEAGQTTDYTEAGLQPAGVFYFKIRDFSVDGDDSHGIPDPDDPEDLAQRMRRFYRMEGVVINDASLIGAMDENVDGSDKAESNVIPVKYDPKK